MALPATLVWEVRPTNGTANAGGGFDPSVASPGTDYSQQNAAQIAYTDLVIDAVTNTKVTSAGNAFTSAHVGNNIAVTGGTGFTTGIYNVRSVAAAVATLDRAVGTTGSTGGTGNLGGARSGFTVGTTTLQASLVAGNIVHVKNEAWNEAVSLTVAGAAGTPIIIRGYNTARNDNPTGSSRPLNNRASAAGDGITNSAANYIFQYLMVTAAGDAGFSNTGGTTRYEWCKAYSNTGEGFETAGANAVFIHCEGNNNTTNGIGPACTGDVIGCYIHDNTQAGIICNSNSVRILYTISEANGGHGLSGIAPASVVMNSTFDGNTGASTSGMGSMGNTPNSMTTVLNNIFSNNGQYGVNGVDVDSAYTHFNCYYGNTTAAWLNWATNSDDSTLDPTFTNRASGDFSIGTNLKALGYPGVFPGAISTGYVDIGAVQRQEAASGGLAANPLRGFI